MAIVNGKRTVIVVPTPTVESTSTTPPSRSKCGFDDIHSDAAAADGRDFLGGRKRGRRSGSRLAVRHRAASSAVITLFPRLSASVCRVAAGPVVGHTRGLFLPDAWLAGEWCRSVPCPPLARTSGDSSPVSIELRTRCRQRCRSPRMIDLSFPFTILAFDFQLRLLAESLAHVADHAG